MKITLKHLHRIIKEEVAAAGKKTRFLHGEDPDDSEGAMAESRLGSLAKMAEELSMILEPDDQLPGWVQDHISVAHENLQQVHGYMMGRVEGGKGPAIALSVESRRRR